MVVQCALIVHLLDLMHCYGDVWPEVHLNGACLENKNVKYSHPAF
jgi:hypothetical protein